MLVTINMYALMIIDFSKAIDSVDHFTLILRLKAVNMGDNII